MGKTFLDVNGQETTIESGYEIYGNTGAELAGLTAMANNVKIDGHVERVALLGSVDDYKFMQPVGSNNLRIYFADSGILAATVIIQAGVFDADGKGTLLTFADGTVSVKLVAGSIPTMTFGGQPIDTGAPTPIPPGYVIDGSLTSQGDAINLTVDMDTFTGNVFNSVQAYTPGGTALINTLQDGDTLTGQGENPTLNVTLGSANDAGTYIVTPTLNGIETINLKVGGDNIGGLNLQDATGLQEVNVQRITANNSDFYIEDLDSTVNSLSVANATQDGELYFGYKEEVLTATNDTVSLTLDNVRLNELGIYEGGDSYEDEGYGFETVNVTVNSSTDLDYFYVGEDREEDMQASLDGDDETVVDQTINVTANGRLEINRLDANGAEHINLVANAEIYIGEDPNDNYDENVNSGLDFDDSYWVYTSELQHLTISGAGKVTINGLGGGYDNYMDEYTGVEIDGSTMTGTLAVRIEDSIAGEDTSSLVSGSGADEIIINDDSYMTISTNAGNDTILIGDNDNNNYSYTEYPYGYNYYSYVTDYRIDHYDDGNDGSMYGEVFTGAGADTVTVNGSVFADLDTGSAEDGVADGDTIIITGDSGDDYQVHYNGSYYGISYAYTSYDNDDDGYLDNASIRTGAGDDSITIDGGVIDSDDTTNHVIDMADGDDTLTVSYGLAATFAVSMGAGDDIVSFGEDTEGTISTGTGNDEVYVGDDVKGNIDLGTGSDSLIIEDDLFAAVTAGSAEETGNANGQDYVEVGDDMRGTASIDTAAGDDEVYVGGDMEATGTADSYMGGKFSSDNLFVTSPPLTTEEGGAGKVEGDADIDTTMAAAITTGDGNDTVTVDGNMYSAGQWNDNLIENNLNADDTITIVGASIMLGAGNDTLTLGNPGGYGEDYIMEEQTLIDAGAGDDTVTIKHNQAVVMAADNTGFAWEYTDYETVAPHANRATELQDTLGAKIELGAGDDSLLFTDVGFDAMGYGYNTTTLIVDDGAVIDGGDDFDTLTVETVDKINVVASTTYEQAVTAEATHLGNHVVVGDTNNLDDAQGQGGYIKGVEEINLTIENAISQDTIDHGLVHFTYPLPNDVDPGVTDLNGDGVADVDPMATDDADNTHFPNFTPYNSVMTLDVKQVDADLETVNLVSNEARLKIDNYLGTDGLADNASNESGYGTDDVENGFIEASESDFRINNFRGDIDLTLKAYETDVAEDALGDGYGGGYGDQEGYPLPAFECESDVTVNVNMEAKYTGTHVNGAFDATDLQGSHEYELNRAFTLSIESNVDLANQEGEEDYDVTIISEDVFTSTGGAGYGQEEQVANYAKDITIELNDIAASRKLYFEDAFGNVNDTRYVIRNAADVIVGDVEATSINGGERTDLQNEVIREFGTVFHSTGWDTAPLPTDVRTSLTVNGTVAGENIGLDLVAADVITVNGDANIYLTVREENAYDITTGGGDDVIDMTNDILAVDNLGTTVIDEADYVDAGANATDFGDTLYISADQDVTAGVFSNISNVENLAINFIEGVDGETDIAVLSNKLDRLIIVNTPESTVGTADDGINDTDTVTGTIHTVNLTVGNTSLPLVTDSLLINADTDISELLDPCNPDENNIHSNNLILNVTSVGTNLEIITNVSEGTAINLNVADAVTVDIVTTVSALANTVINADIDDTTNVGLAYIDNTDPTALAVTGDAEGELLINTVDSLGATVGRIDSITLIDQTVDADGVQVGTDAGSVALPGQNTDNIGADLNEIQLTVSDTWATTALFIDASDIEDSADTASTLDRLDVVYEQGVVTDATANRNFINGSAEKTAILTIEGTQDADWISGGVKADVISGNLGNDEIHGGAGNDTINGDEGNDDLFGEAGLDTINGGAGNDWIIGGDAMDTLTGGEGNDTFFYLVNNGAPTPTQNESIMTNPDTITDFVSGTDKFYVDFGTLNGGTAGGRVVNFGRFDSPALLSEGLILDGSEPNPIIGDAFWTVQTGRLYIDVDGNGAIEDNTDLVVITGAANPVVAADIDNTINITDGNNLIRLGQGVDHITTGAGLDTFAIVGSIDAADKEGYELAGSGIISAYVQQVVVYNDITHERSETEANVGDYIDGGDGIDTLHIFGDADLTDVNIVNVETLAIHSTVTMTYEQLWSFDTIEVFSGVNDDMVHNIIISDFADYGYLTADDAFADWFADGNILAFASPGTLTIGESAYEITTGTEIGETIYGTPEVDWLFGMGGDDSLYGEDSDDSLGGGDGDDYLDGSYGNDHLYGDAGNDTIYGGTYGYYGYGEDGDNDVIDGGAGNDYIVGQDSADILTGGAGSDWFVYETIYDGAGVWGEDAAGEWNVIGGDIITDFNALEGDEIHLSGWDFDVYTWASGQSAGQLDPFFFAAGSDITTGWYSGAIGGFNPATSGSFAFIFNDTKGDDAGLYYVQGYQSWGSNNVGNIELIALTAAPIASTNIYLDGMMIL